MTSPPSKFPMGVTATRTNDVIALTLRNPYAHLFSYFRANNEADFRQELRGILGPREDVTATHITALGIGAPIFHWSIDDLYHDKETPL